MAAMAGALVVMFGAAYAFVFAVSKLNGDRWLSVVAYGCFAGLSLCVLVLAKSLNMDGYWQIVTVTMLVGYLLAPQAIWKYNWSPEPGSPEAELYDDYLRPRDWLAELPISDDLETHS